MIEKLKDRKIVVWGFTGEASRKNPYLMYATSLVHEMLQREGLWGNVAYCVDRAKSEQGRNAFGGMTFPPQKLLEDPDAAVILNTNSQDAVLQDAEAIGLKNDFYFIPSHFYNNFISSQKDGLSFYQWMSKNIQRIFSLYDLSDQTTIEKLKVLAFFAAQGYSDVYRREFYQNTAFQYPYFCDPILAPKGDITYVDIGAYIGDSIAPMKDFYGERLKKIYAFEPGEKRLEALRNYLVDNSLDEITSVFDCGLGSVETNSSYDPSTGIGCKGGDDDIIVKRFDDIYDGHIGTLMIKMDIEGAEMDALKGMENVIKNEHPYMAVCVYHKLGDIVEIPEYLKHLYSGYRFYLRGGWHLECWAVPEE